LQTEIRNLCRENVEDAILACTPEGMKDDTLYKQGMEVRRKWLLHTYQTVGPCAKIAYINRIPAGMIQYTPLHHVPYFTTKRRDALYIHCIFTKKDFRLKGVADKLLRELIKEIKKPAPIFQNKPCRLFVTSARERYFSNQPSYFRKKGFRPIEGCVDAGLALWLSKPSLDEGLNIPRVEMPRVKEEGVKIFYSPTCQWCIRLNENVKKLIQELKPDIKIEEINIWDQPEEALKRGIASRVTYINGKPTAIVTLR